MAEKTADLESSSKITPNTTNSSQDQSGKIIDQGLSKKKCSSRKVFEMKMLFLSRGEPKSGRKADVVER